MSAVNRIVTSREFKLMLKVDLFRDRKEGSKALWELVKAIAEKSGGEAEADEETKVRKTWYLDTPDLEFRQRHNYILRLREERNADKRYKITLKYRNPDRYVSASKITSFSEGAQERFNKNKDEIDLKFEEDIVPDFESKFSNSTSVETDDLPKLTTVEQVARLYPCMGELDIAPETAIRTVRGFTAHEVARWLCKFDFGKPKIKAALSFWYASEEETGLPLVAEFSFDYDARKKDIDKELERYPIEVVEGGNRLFKALLGSAWINRGATTKTRYAYLG